MNPPFFPSLRQQGSIFLAKAYQSSHALLRKVVSCTSGRKFTSSSTPPQDNPFSTPPNTTCPTSFPCLDELEAKTARLQQEYEARLAQSGPEPTYSSPSTLKGYRIYTHPGKLHLDLGGTLPYFQLAYETWGTLNTEKSNAILLHTGLSASSHAKSHAENPAPGWWESFIGPNAPLDTDRFFVICTNVLGGCFGSTGPSSIDPTTQQPYATRFPFVTLWDMLRCQHALVTSLGITRLWASVGSSLGGMQSLAYASMYPGRVQKLVTISSCAKAHPYSIALRFVQRQMIMADPAYTATRGHYYGKVPPHIGMKLARELATITYRSGPEWELRFGRKRMAEPSQSSAPAATLDQEMQAQAGETSLCPDFEIEHYLAHQGEKFSLNYDANSLLYISKAMDLFDMSAASELDLQSRSRTLDTPPPPRTTTVTPTDAVDADAALVRGMRAIQVPTLVLGVVSDVLFPLPQQAEVARALARAGNAQVTFYTLDAIYGHDTFLIDRVGVGAAIRGHLA